MSVLLQTAELNAKTIFAWIVYIGFFVGALAIVWHILRESERESVPRDGQQIDPQRQESSPSEDN